MDATIRQAITLLASASASQLALDDAEDPAAVAVAVQGAIERLHAVRAEAVARVDVTAAWQVDGAATPTAWARSALGLGTSAAHELVRTARSLHRELPETAAALAGGQVSWAHVATLARHALATPARAAAVAEPGGERLLLDVARVATVDQLGRALRAWAHAVDQAGFTADEATLYEQRQITLAQTLDGVWYLNGLLPPAAGAALASVLDAHVAASLGTADPRTPAQVRADALTDLAMHATDAETTPRRGGGRAHLLVHVPVATLVRAEGCSPAELAYGDTALSAATTAALACDSLITRLLTDPEGLPVGVGRTRRSVPLRIRHAVIARDRTCTYPGCARPPTWCDAHHIIPWAQGGPTDLENLILLCRYHHTQVHLRELRITPNPGMPGWRFTLPDGAPLGSTPRGLRVPAPLARPSPLVRA
jgi:hypothetical protein